jgi:hypothetical protein
MLPHASRNFVRAGGGARLQSAAQRIGKLVVLQPSGGSAGVGGRPEPLFRLNPFLTALGPVPPLRPVPERRSVAARVRNRLAAFPTGKQMSASEQMSASPEVL